MILDFEDLAEVIHENAKQHGWWDEQRSFPEILALIHSEVSEALEEYRNGRALTEIYYHCTLDGVNADDECADTEKECYFRTGEEWCDKAKPEGIPIELADVIIRILDFCGYAGINMDEALRIKHLYNQSRPYRHGGKKC